MSPNNTSRIENRRYQRHELSPPWRIQICFDDATFEAHMVDLSRDGIKLHFSMQSIPESHRARFELNFTVFLTVFFPSGRQSRFEAAIRWIRQTPDVAIIGFQYIDPVGKTLIYEMVDEMLAKVDT